MEVASFTDAWIETNRCLAGMNFSRSHLLQMRGLKRQSPTNNTMTRMVASFTDAWIETRYVNHLGNKESGRIFYRCVD